MYNSKFVGRVGEWIGTSILAWLLIVFTFGIATPWAICMFIRYFFANSIIEGRKLKFTGSGGGLFGNWIIWCILTCITFGIYGFWVPNKVANWVVTNTTFE